MEAINFMYFLNNYSQEQLIGVFNATSCPAHVEEKFISLANEYQNGTRALSQLFFELSRDNQIRMVEYVNENYNGIRWEKDLKAS